jgi:glutamate dehydrogenase
MATLTPNGDQAVNQARNKLVEQVIRTPGRQPSPQPTMLGVPGASQSNQSLHKILSDHSTGYVAPKFEGKKIQMEEGMFDPHIHDHILTSY